MPDSTPPPAPGPSEELKDLVGRIIAAATPLVELHARVEASEAFRCARAYSRAIAGTTTWYATGKRHVHEPQLEAIVAELAHHTAGTESLVELGAGKGMLGRILQEAIGKPLMAVERRNCTHYDRDDATRVSSDLQDVNLDTIIPEKSLVLAKHFCGNATDSAIESVIASKKVCVAAIAPCCHPQIAWESYTGRAYLESLGFGERDFATFLELLFMSRNQGGVVSSKSCKRWKELRTLPDSELYRLGRLCRRLIEEGRIRALLAGGFHDAKLILYAPDAITPDNYLIVAHRAPLPAGCSYPLVAVGDRIVPIKQGVVLHVTGERSSPGRIAQYLLELRAAGAGGAGEGVAGEGASPTPIRTVRVHNLRHGGVVVVVEGEPASLLALLKSDRLLTHAVDMAFPFVRQDAIPREATDAEIGAKIHALVDSGLFRHFYDTEQPEQAGSTAEAEEGKGPEAKKQRLEGGNANAPPGRAVRVASLPKSLEGAHFPRYFSGEVNTVSGANSGASSFLFSPKQFTHTLFLLLWEDQLGARSLLSAMSEQGLFNPRDWRGTARLPTSFAPPGGAAAAEANKTVKKLMHLVEEVQDRWPAYAVSGRRILVVCDDAREKNLKDFGAYLLSKGAVSVAIASPAVEGGGGSSEKRPAAPAADPSAPAAPAVQEKKKYFLKPAVEGGACDMCIAVLDRGSQASVLRSAVPAELLEEGCPVFGRLKLGSQSRGRAVVDKQTAAWRAEGFAHTVVHHLLTDKETDRTVLSTWTQHPPQAGQSEQ